MTDKSIDISEDLYNKLKHLKSKGESFSDFILRLIKEKNVDINDKIDIDTEEWEKIVKIQNWEEL
ncbi:MAG: DUF7557 family protein [Promethearchaeia archaeon]